MLAGTGCWSAAVDFGGTLTDVVLRPDAAPGGADRLCSLPSDAVVDADRLALVLEVALASEGLGASDLERIVVTGGRSGELPGHWRGVTVHRVPETEAIASAASLAAGVRHPALVASLGTGTALVLADPPRAPLHLVGSGVGGGTLLGLSRLLLGTSDVAELGALARAGDARACDLLVRDILGGGIGSVPPDATAAHFGRLGRPVGPQARPNPPDVASALVNLVSQSILRLAFEAAGRHRAGSIVLVGRLLDVEGFLDAIRRIPSLDRGFVLWPTEPGFAIARGALECLSR